MPIYVLFSCYVTHMSVLKAITNKFQSVELKNQFTMHKDVQFIEQKYNDMKLNAIEYFIDILVMFLQQYKFIEHITIHEFRVVMSIAKSCHCINESAHFCKSEKRKDIL